MAAIGQNTQAATDRVVRDLARPLEFAFVGVAPADPGTHGDYIRQRVADGRDGEMD